MRVFKGTFCSERPILSGEQGGLGREEQPARVEEEVDDSEHDEDEDDDGGSQKTPSGDAEAEKRTEDGLQMRI